MIHSLFFRIIFLVAFLFVVFPVAASAQNVATATVTAVYMVADPTSSNGYKELYRWPVSSQDQWARIHNNIDSFPKKTELEVNPFMAKEKEDHLVVLIQNDRNGITGEDFYLSKKGIMRVARKPFDTFYRDVSSLKKFLEEELRRRVNYTETDVEGFPIDSPGIVAVFDINETLKNPMWHITDMKDLRLYDSFFRGIKVLVDNEADSAAESSLFRQRNNFMMYLNYKNAPARFVTVTDRYIRLSRVGLTNTYHEDTGKYFDYFLGEAKNQAMSETERKKKAKQDASRRQF
jgi:hypothetical protein